MGDFEGWARDFFSMLQNPESAIGVFIAIFLLSGAAVLVGFLTRKLFGIALIGLLLYGLWVYGDQISYWFQRTF
jgi:hypothetical protein